MKRALLTLAAATIAHAVFWAISLATAAAAHGELRARGIDLLEPEGLLEMGVRDGLFSAPVNVVIAGMLAALCVSPLLEMAVAGAASGTSSLRAAYREAIRLTPASAVATLASAVATVSVLGFAALVPWGVDAFLDDGFDDRTRAGALALALTPALGALLAFGVSVDVGRIRLARGGALLDSVGRGFRASWSTLLPLYTVTLSVGLVASVAHAWLGRNDDAPSLVAGGVVLFARPVSRVLFMLVAARHELTR
jgi:hypothetical protein